MRTSPRASPTLLAAVFFLVSFGAPSLALASGTQNQLAALPQENNGPATPSSGTTSFIFDGNRMYAEVVFVRPDGTLYNSFAFVDMGSPSTIVSPALFKELGLDQKKPLTFRVGKLTVNVDSSEVAGDSWLPFSVGGSRKVEMVLPAGVMQKFQVVIDYAQHTLTFAQPGTLKPQGTPIPFRMNEKSALIAVDVTVNGKSYPITIDNGSAYTWLRKPTALKWLASHPDWQRGIGAVGASNMRMEDDGIEADGIIIRIPELKLGSLSVHQAGALAIGPSRANWDFMDWYSKKNPIPVIGWLGGNVLRGFQITIDYPNRVSYWLAQTALDPHDLDQVGLTLISRKGEYFVAALATQNGKRAIEGVQVGDKLLKVDEVPMSGSTRGAILSAMHGKPGEIRVLTLERNDKTFTVQASVKSF